MSYLEYAFIGLLVAAGVAGIMTPFLHYVLVGWKAKRHDIVDGLDENAREIYLEVFASTQKATHASDDKHVFETLYDTWYGQKYYIAPGLLLFLIVLVTVAMVAVAGLHTMGLNSMVKPEFYLPPTAIAALAGAYLWVADDFISRARRLDFSPTDALWGTLRFIIAIPMGYAFASIAPTQGPFIAFALGAFPLTTLTTLLQRFASKALGVQPTADDASDDIIKLQGVNRAIADRLAMEDITTVTQIAYCDPVRLTMRSNLSFNFVTDCMGQALAWMYFGDQLASVLRPLGLRGAVEIKHLVNDFDSTSTDPADVENHNRAKATIPLIAQKLGQSPETLQLVLREIAGDPFTVFLTKVWT